MVNSENIKIKVDIFHMAKGIFKCSECGKNMFFDKKNCYYVCLGRKKRSCSQGYIKQEILEQEFAKLATEFQRNSRKSKKLKELKSRLKNNGKQLRKEIKRYNADLASEAKNILLIDETKPKKALRFEVDGTKEIHSEKTRLISRLDATNELLEGFVGLLDFANIEMLDLTSLHFTKILIKNKRITEVELMPGMDYLVQLARSENYYAGCKIKHNEKLMDMEFNELLENLGKDLFGSCIYYLPRPSRKTLNRENKKSDREQFREFLFQKIIMIAIKFPPFKKVWNRQENPTEMERALDYARSLNRSPSPYGKERSKPVTAENAIKVLKHQIKEFDWLIKHQPSHYESYYNWEDITRHQLGKTFGFKSEIYNEFLKKCDLLKFSVRRKENRIKRFYNNKEKKKYFLESLIYCIEETT